MNVPRLATTALLLLPLLYCGGDSKTDTAPVEKVREFEEPAGEDPAPAWHSAIDAINVDQDRLGWKGIYLEDTLESIETALGHELSLERMQSPSCGEYYADLDDEGMVVTLQFESSEPGAKLESLFLQLPPFGNDKAELVERIKSQIPTLVYQPSIHEPDLTEDENPIPTYLLPDDLIHAILIKPQEGMYIAISLCLD